MSALDTFGDVVMELICSLMTSDPTIKGMV